MKENKLLHNRRCSFLFAAAFCAISASACSQNENTAALLTDNPLFAFYVEEYNTSQNVYKIEVSYTDGLAEQILMTGETAGNGNDKKYADIIVGRFVRDANADSFFREITEKDLDKKILEEDFYPQLLASGRIKNKQYLLPVCFDLNLMAFSKQNSGLIPNNWTISLTEILTLSPEYNKKNKTEYTRMGFSPLWNPDFLIACADLFGADFKRANPLEWNNENMEKSIQFCASLLMGNNDDADANANRNPASLREIDDFSFKYLYEPEDKLAAAGTILFTMSKASDFFMLQDERRDQLDYRWIMGGEHIDTCENLVYFGFHRRTKALKAARAFMNWFFSTETQSRLLEKSRERRISESYFGIAQGFSSLKTVVEQVYPQYYPSIIGHLPPAENLDIPNILPWDFDDIKTRVLVPYLTDRLRKTAGAGTDASAQGTDGPDKIKSLESRLSDWTRTNYY